MEFKFNDSFVAAKIEDLINIKIGRTWIDREQIDQVIDILDLNNKTNDELTAIRNSVVKLFANEENKYYNDDVFDIPNFDKYHWTRSGVVAVIDDVMYKRLKTIM